MSNVLAHQAAQELLGVYAVGALEAEERTLLEQHLHACAECRATVDEHRAALAAIVPDEEEPPALFERIAAEVGLRPAKSRARVISFPQRRVHVGVAVAAAVAASVVLTLVVSRDDGLGPLDAQAALVAAMPAADVIGTVRLYSEHEEGGTLVVDLSAVPPAPSGHHYEVWVLRSSAGGAMEAVGSFTPARRSARLELPLPGPGDYGAVDISIQADGGPPEHSGTSLAGATLD